MTTATAAETRGLLPVSAVCGGAFRLSDAQGNDITPRGTKARALLAILLLTPEMSRPRRWVESTLWSTRDADQANASLRQSLTEIRRALGPLRDLIDADRRDVWLVPDAFAVDVLAAGAAPQPGRYLLEGLDPRDAAYNRWLAETALALGWPVAGAAQGVRTGPPAPVLTFESDATGSRLESLLSGIVSDQVLKNLAESADFQFQAGGGTPADHAPGVPVFGLTTSVVAHQGTGYFTLRLSDTLRRRMIWTRHVSVPLTEADLLESPELFKLAHEAAEHAVAALSHDPTGVAATRLADVIMSRALNEMFSFDKARLLAADTLLEQAEALRPRAVHWAWRCFLRMIMAVERTGQDWQVLAEQAEAFAARAIEMDPRNSLVLALVSQMRLLMQGDIEGGARLAQDALALNKGSAMAHVGLATVALRRSDLVEARAAANRALGIAAHSAHRHWWHMFVCLAEIASGDYDAAIRSAEAALSYAPKFRPPLRHLYVLYLHRQDHARAIQIARRLRELEPDFSLKLIREDASYPAGTLRRTPLIQLQDVI
jgi:DNA-binding SARP family transcriptional activator